MVSSFAWRLQVLDSTGSTNDVARAAAEQGEPEGFAVQALEQVSGRGRHGRVWLSPIGNLYLSVLLRPQNMFAGLGWHSLICALAIRDTVLHFVPDLTDTIALKWPNDVLVNGAKISGVLLEVSGDALICGMGVNVRVKPNQPLYPTIMLSDLGITADVTAIRDILLEKLSHWITIYRTGGSDPVRAGWQKAALRGQVSVNLPTEKVIGEFHSIDDNACLVIRAVDQSLRTLSVGDVFPVGVENAAGN